MMVLRDYSGISLRIFMLYCVVLERSKPWPWREFTATRWERRVIVTFCFRWTASEKMGGDKAGWLAGVWLPNFEWLFGLLKSKMPKTIHKAEQHAQNLIIEPHKWSLREFEVSCYCHSQRLGPWTLVWEVHVSSRWSKNKMRTNAIVDIQGRFACRMMCICIQDRDECIQRTNQGREMQHL